MNWPEDFVNKIICGDCLEVMKEMPDGCVDITFTSPPFRDNSEKDKRRKHLGNIKGNYWDWYDRFMSQISRITKDYAFIFNSSTRLIEIVKRYESPYRILIWNKIRSQCGYRYEPILIYKFNYETRLTYFLNSLLYTDVFSCFPILGNKQSVPNENPIKLYAKILKILPENKIILDPCIGSGTTAVAAKNLKHDFIGIEINEKYCKIAEERLAQGVL